MVEFAADWQKPAGRFALVAAHFNWLVVQHLLTGAKHQLQQFGVSESAIDVAHVPGALEIPVTAQLLASSGHYAAVIGLGAVLRGETSHHEVVVSESAKGLSQVALATGVPTINAILTCDTLEQAFDRAGGKGGNKGAEAALAAVQMAKLFQNLKSHLQPHS